MDEMRKEVLDCENATDKKIDECIDVWHYDEKRKLEPVTFDRFNKVADDIERIIMENKYNSNDCWNMIIAVAIQLENNMLNKEAFIENCERMRKVFEIAKERRKLGTFIDAVIEDQKV
jgi:hypothetical protein